MRPSYTTVRDGVPLGTFAALRVLRRQGLPAEAVRLQCGSVRVAIVGAGMAGLAAARALAARGVDVCLFDKGRGVGGRCATRGRDLSGARTARPLLSFDHGAQRFSARSERFGEVVRSWASEGRVAPVRAPRGEETWWVPTSSMSALPASFAAGLRIRTSTRVQSLRRRDHAWWLALEGAEDAGPFEVVIATAPAPQSLSLLAPHGALFESLGAIAYDPCWALTLACDADESLALPEDVFTEDEDDPVISLVSREGKKPGRPAEGPLACLVVHASVAFSRTALERSEAEVAGRLLVALRQRDGLGALRARFAHAHRWRFARVSKPLGEPCLFDRSRGLGVAGDGLLGPRIEAAWTSGEAVADAILA